jgi:hypothetical protein
MSSSRPRQSILLLIIAFAMGAGSLLVAGSALADEALFRVQQIWHSVPNPADPRSPGGAGIASASVIPYLTKKISHGEEVYIYTPGVAIVSPGNPIGAKFTLPTKQFLDLQGTYDITAKTGWPGYTTYSYLSYYNGPVRMKPQNTHTNQDPTRIVFPTTMGNPPRSNLGTGQPVTPTETFGGIYDATRGGEINVTPGPRQFGGTYRYFHGPNNSTFYQYINKFDPLIYDAFGHYTCFDEGTWGCTKDNFVSDIGDTTIIYTFTRFLQNVKGTGTGDRLQSSSAKATTPTGEGGYPTVNGQGTPSGGPASYVIAVQRYLDLIHPWTTGFASVSQPVGSPNIITPYSQGYDIDLQGEPKVTVTVTNYASVWNKTLSELDIETSTRKSYLYNVGRVVSLVRPRLIHTYTTPVDHSKPIWMSWGVARIWRLKVWFLPEPTGMLLLGTGIAALLGLARIRRR